MNCASASGRIIARAAAPEFDGACVTAAPHGQNRVHRWFARYRAWASTTEAASPNPDDARSRRCRRVAAGDRLRLILGVSSSSQLAGGGGDLDLEIGGGLRDARIAVDHRALWSGRRARCGVVDQGESVWSWLR